MMERYQTFQKYGVRDMKGYNKKVESIQEIPGEDKPKKDAADRYYRRRAGRSDDGGFQ